MLGVVFKASSCGGSVAGADVLVVTGGSLGFRGFGTNAAVEVTFDSVVLENSDVETGVLEAVTG